MRDVRLETADLVLRELTLDDFAAVHRWGSDPEVVRHMIWGPNDERQTREFLELQVRFQREDARLDYELGIVVRATGDLVGAAGTRLTSAGGQVADLGYCLRRDAWGKGYATQAARAMVRFAFERLGVHRLWATCDVDNLASARVLEKVGMTREGRLRAHQLRHGTWRDDLLFAILATDPRP